MLLFGDCDLQMEADFLRREAAASAVSICASPTGFPDDLRLAAERAHEAIFIGALRSRHAGGPGPPAIRRRAATRLHRRGAPR